MLAIGRLLLDDPEKLDESIGDTVERVGPTPVPGTRQGQRATLALHTFPSVGENTAGRMRVRRQLRSLMNNRPLILGGLYVLWDQDPEQSGWYVIEPAELTPGEINALAHGWFRATLPLRLLGRRPTHRRAVGVHLLDRRINTTPDDQLWTKYLGDFSGLAALALTWLPSNVQDVVVRGTTTLVLSAPRLGQGGASIVAVVGAQDGARVHFEQPESARNSGDVVLYDRRNVLTAPAAGPDAAWEEAYGPDWPLAEGDAPVLDNGLCRVRLSSANNVGLAVDAWAAGAWDEQGKLLVQRIGDSSGPCDALVSASILEWTPERAVISLILRRTADLYSREQVFVTLQRGWTGPRVEAYPTPLSSGAGGDAALVWFAIGAPAGDSALKVDSGGAAAVQQAAGAFSPGAIGASTFTGENQVSLLRGGAGFAMQMAVVQANLAGRVEASSAAYGATRNGIAVQSTGSTGYVSAHLGLGAEVAGQQLEAEAMVLAAGSAVTADGAASGGSAVTTTRTAEADHVTVATWPSSTQGRYRVLARVRTSSGGTLSVRAQIGATTGAVRTTTSTTYVWLDLGDMLANASTLQIRAWITSGTLFVDRMEAHLLEGRTGPSPLYGGARDLGQSALYDARAFADLVGR